MEQPQIGVIKLKWMVLTTWNIPYFCKLHMDFTHLGYVVFSTLANKEMVLLLEGPLKMKTYGVRWLMHLDKLCKSQNVPIHLFQQLNAT